MNIYQLRAFSLLSTNLHYQKTADLLGVSQPSLSRTIKSLENELGVPLFERQGRGVVLSKYGSAFAAHVNISVRELDEGLSRVKDLLNPQNLNIHIAVNYFLSMDYLPTLITEFEKDGENQGLNFILTQTNTHTILSDLRAGLNEIGFCSYMKDQPDIRFTPIQKCPLCAIVPLDHPLAKKDKTTLEEVARYPLVMSRDKTYFSEELFRKAHLTPNVVFRMNEDHAIANFVARGHGLSVLPRQNQLAACGVKLLELEDESAFRIFYMATSRNHALSPAALKFYHYAKKMAAAPDLVEVTDF